MSSQLQTAQRILRPIGIQCVYDLARRAYRVSYQGMAGVADYYTVDISDAIDTGRAMAQPYQGVAQ